MSFSKSWNCTSRFGECNFAFWKTHKCKLIPNWTRKTVWLPINNIHEKICVKDVLNFTDSELSSQFCARAKPQISIITQSRKNCAIQGARLIWKQEIWLAICELLCSLSNQNACFITFFCIQLPLFCTVLRKNCTVLNQSEWSNFFMYIIITINCCRPCWITCTNFSKQGSFPHALSTKRSRRPPFFFFSYFWQTSNSLSDCSKKLEKT